MKVNKIFHWLYFLMLLLPIFAIPIYALYMTNKNATFTQEITVSENKVVDFNQKFTFDQNFSYDNGTLNVDTTSFHFEYESNNNENDKVVYANSGEININDILIVKFEYISNINFRFQGIYESSELLSTNTYSLFQNRGSLLEGYSTYYWYNYDSISSTWTLDVKNIQTFNLTQMFGSGNEPTLQQFNDWYPNDYYDYTLSQKQLLKDYDQTTYTDTDVGSQFTYMLYNSVDKYFNYDNVYNFGTLYDYFQLNFFNGNAPIGFFIFWHYLIYFLLTSLLWLLFDVLMYVPNLIHRWIDKAEL